MKFYIKERYNPQFNNPYFIACGQMSAKDAKKAESATYGANIMNGYETKEEYEAAQERLKSEGFRVTTY